MQVELITTVLNKRNQISTSKLVCQSDIEALETYLGNGVITDKIPLNKFTTEGSGLYVDEVVILLNDIIKSNEVFKSLSLSHLLSDVYQCRREVSDFAFTLDTIKDGDYTKRISELATDTKKQYAIGSDGKEIDLWSIEFLQAYRDFVEFRNYLGLDLDKLFHDPLEDSDDEKYHDTLNPYALPALTYIKAISRNDGINEEDGLPIIVNPTVSIKDLNDILLQRKDLSFQLEKVINNVLGKIENKLKNEFSDSFNFTDDTFFKQFNTMDALKLVKIHNSIKHLKEYFLDPRTKYLLNRLKF